MTEEVKTSEHSHTAAGAKTAIDPVCNMTVNPESVGSHEHDGQTYYLQHSLPAQIQGQSRSKGARWQGELKKLAEATGAYAHFQNDMSRCEEAMKAMVEEVGRQYRLEYYSNNPANNLANNPTRDGKWRKITVVISPEGKKATARVVRTRTGYYSLTKER